MLVFDQKLVTFGWKRLQFRKIEISIEQKSVTSEFMAAHIFQSNLGSYFNSFCYKSKLI